MAHSEEPWEMLKSDEGFVGWDEEAIGIMAEGGIIAEVFRDIGEDKKADVEANARLMVLAPRMFRLLESLNYFFNHTPEFPFHLLEKAEEYQVQIKDLVGELKGINSPTPEKE